MVQINSVEFLQKAEERHGNKYNYDNIQFINISTKILIRCPIHGDFWQTPDSHLRSGGCYDCGREKFKISMSYTFEEFLGIANQKYNNFFDYSQAEYVNFGSKIKIICPLHDEFYTTPSIHVRGKYGCWDCYNAAQTSTASEFIGKANIKHNFKYDYLKVVYINSYTKVEIICSNHDEPMSFLQGPDSHLEGAGCPYCSRIISYKEILWLDSIGVPRDPNYRQVKFHFGRHGSYWVDGYKPETKTICEFDGDFWHGNPVYYDPNDWCHPKEMSFGELYRKTLKRNSAYNKMGYGLEVIWESDYMKSLGEEYPIPRRY